MKRRISGGMHKREGKDSGTKYLRRQPCRACIIWDRQSTIKEGGSTIRRNGAVVHLLLCEKQHESMASTDCGCARVPAINHTNSSALLCSGMITLSFFRRTGVVKKAATLQHVVTSEQDALPSRKLYGAVTSSCLLCVAHLSCYSGL